jgi:outer membrane lipoprotein
MKTILFALFTSLLLTACSSLPENLNSSAENLITDYTAWNETVKNNTPVRLGGVVANVSNLAEKTRIEVVNLPINKSGKPDIGQEPSGRFVAYIDGFADPVTLSKGRLITLLGNTSDEELGKVGEYEYTFPVMEASGFHLWRIEERVIVNDFDSYLHPCTGLYCRSMRSSTKQGKVIQEVR